MRSETQNFPVNPTKITSHGTIRKNGRSLYVGIDPSLKKRLKPGDKIIYQILGVIPSVEAQLTTDIDIIGDDEDEPIFKITQYDRPSRTVKKRRHAPTGKSTPIPDDQVVEVYTTSGTLIARLRENEPSYSFPAETRAGGSALLYAQRCAHHHL